MCVVQSGVMFARNKIASHEKERHYLLSNFASCVISDMLKIITTTKSIKIYKYLI